MKQTVYSKVWAVVALIALACLPQLAPAQSRAEVELRAAIETETVKGDVKKAIEQYKKLAGNADRAVAARALVRLGGVYQARGNAEARSVFERVVKEFKEQKEAVAAAQAQLGRPSTGQGKLARLVGSGGDSYDSITLDGRYASHQLVGRGSSTGLVVRDLMTGVDRQLAISTDGNMEIGYSSMFSPDGRHIAYSWADYSQDHSRGELRISPVRGGEAPRILVARPDIEYIGPTAWSPDGKWIAVELDLHDKSQVAVVSVANGAVRTLDAVEQSPDKTFFSPDSKYLAIDARSGPSALRDLFLYPVDGGPRIPLVTFADDNRVMGWAADGRLLYTRGVASLSLWALTVRDGRAQGTAVRLSENVGDSPVALTTAGALHYTTRTGGSELQVATMDFAADRILTPRTSPLAARGSEADWSPDGKYVAFLGEDGALLIRSVDTGQTRFLRVWGRFPKWSPDSRSLLVQRRRSQTLTEVVSVDVTTGAETQLAHLDRGPDQLIDQPLWSRDGQKIYFRKRVTGSDPHVEIIERDLASGTERQLIQRRSLNPPSLSPDGKYLASVAPGVAMLIPVDGTAPRELFRAPANEIYAVSMWAPDSRSAYVWLSRAQQMLRVPLDGSPPRPVDLNMNMEQVVGPVLAVHPNGRQVAYSVNQGPIRLETWVLENFLPPLK